MNPQSLTVLINDAPYVAHNMNIDITFNWGCSLDGDFIQSGGSINVEFSTETPLILAKYIEGKNFDVKIKSSANGLWLHGRAIFDGIEMKYIDNHIESLAKFHFISVIEIYPTNVK